jgi:hypothetical protein
MSGIKIGQHIVRVLERDAKIKEEIGSRIYPLIANSTAALPYIVYTRNSITEESTKDGFLQNLITEDITVVAKTHKKAIEILDRIYTLISEAEEEKYNDFSVIDAELQDGGDTEKYDDIQAAYVESLQFIFTTN